MNSLRNKITLALLAMSFIVIAVTGLTSRTLVLSRFDDLVIVRAASGFESEVLS